MRGAPGPGDSVTKNGQMSFLGPWRACVTRISREPASFDRRYLPMDHLSKVAAFEIAENKMLIAESKRTIERSQKMIAEISATIAKSRALLAAPRAPQPKA